MKMYFTKEKCGKLNQHLSEFSMGEKKQVYNVKNYFHVHFIFLWKNQGKITVFLTFTFK